SHSIHDGLVELRERVAPVGKDVVVSCGDIVRKGPEVERCLDLWRDRGYLSVLGNNEVKLLGSGALRRLFSIPDDLLKYIATWPVCIDFSKERVTAVHG